MYNVKQNIRNPRKVQEPSYLLRAVHPPSHVLNSFCVIQLMNCIFGLNSSAQSHWMLCLKENC